MTLRDNDVDADVAFALLQKIEVISSSAGSWGSFLLPMVTKDVSLAVCLSACL
jgi:hypothetical protein